jgi:hypothetical protein
VLGETDADPFAFRGNQLLDFRCDVDHLLAFDGRDFDSLHDDILPQLRLLGLATVDKGMGQLAGSTLISWLFRVISVFRGPVLEKGNNVRASIYEKPNHETH